MSKGFSVFLLGLMLLGPAQAVADRPLSSRVIMSGHSLTDPIPPYLAAMVAGAGGRGAVIDRSTIPGSPMDWRWNHPGQPVDARAAIGRYDLLVLTERVPLLDTMEHHNSPQEALRWAEHAWVQGVDTVLYATWVTLATGPEAGDDESRAGLSFRERLEREQARWEAIRAYVNENRREGMGEMQMIPGPQIMLALEAAIAAGEAPGLRDIRDIFYDDIHVNDLGAYIMALAHFAVIYGRDPRDVPQGLGRIAVPEPELGRWLRGFVAGVVAENP
ncbi:hypothetical protein [Natronohydrobacter thiooxidans]|uniref:hypothetical protein n=1 Tax=Natronohydrobacter thiooxidans TaxID=87172 RepID=UPI0008FF0751|nr:hypothetical protein [Natronohydrobacter thiooxidans]